MAAQIIRKSTLALLLLVIATLGCSKSDTANNQNFESATTGNLEIVADEALRPTMDSLVIGFMSENPKAKITVRYESAGEAIKELLEQKARLVVVSRFLTKYEQDALQQSKVTLPEYDIAQDALACIVSSSNPLASLSMFDLRKIVRNEAKSWSDLKTSEMLGAKSNAPVTRVIGPVSSSAETLLDSLFLEPNQMQAGTIARYATTDSIIARVRSSEGAIGFISSSWKHWLDARGDSSVKVIPLIPGDSVSALTAKPIIPHMAYVYQGLYPLTSRVNGYSFESPNTLPRGFLAYATTAHGQTVFKNFDVLPRTQIVKIVPSK